MRLLLDTHIFLWCVNNDPSLPESARIKILQADQVYVSSASIWEMAIKIKLKKLKGNIDLLVEAIDKSGFLKLSITAEHAAAISQLSDFHKDPFDRMLIAQSLVEPLTLLTADSILRKYSPLVEIIN